MATAGYVFVSVAGAGLVASLLKNILGRARPKLYEVVGHFDFHFFAFGQDYASTPSAHATNIFAFATVISVLWPRGRLLLYTLATWIAASHVVVGAHYFTDAALGALLGIAFPYFVRDRFAAGRWVRICAGRRGLPAPRAPKPGLAQLAGTGAEISGLGGAPEGLAPAAIFDRAAPWGLSGQTGLTLYKS
jgi:membrane-associated phospholipid phosphatase